jgi:hypothetical protein
MNRNRIQRDGTSQSQRRLEALDPAQAPVDGRDIADFMVFARELARIVVFRDGNDVDSGDWEELFGCDPSAVIAAIRKTNPEPIRKAVSDILKKAPPEPEDLGKLLTHLTDLMRMLEDWRNGVGPTTGFRTQIDRLIRSNLGTTWQRLVAYHRAAAMRFPMIAFHSADYSGYSDLWCPDSDNVTCDPLAVVPDGSLFDASDAEEQQLLAAYEKLEDLFVPLYRVLLEVIALAPRYFGSDLLRRSDHEPHFALFVAFLRLFLRVRNDANRLTQRHLDFFYEKVLHIKKRSAVPDKLHVIVELGRQVTSPQTLGAATTLDAGKDKTGKPLIYKLDAKLVANKAQIKQYQTVFVDGSLALPERIFAAKVANSQDGLGADFENMDRPSWPTLGSAALGTTAMPAATLGFIVATRDLLLAEGARTITLELTGYGFPQDVASDANQGALNKALTAQLSGKKGWIEVTDSMEVTVTRTVNGENEVSGTLQLVLRLPSTIEAVDLADAKALGEDYGTTEPLLKVTLYNPASDSTISAYRLLENLRLTQVTLKTCATGLTNLVVQNDQSVMDPTKPFQPFGPSPTIGSNFYIGSAEAFQKDLKKLALRITWDNPPASFATHYEGYDVPSAKPATADFQAKVHLLQDGNWLPTKQTEVKLIELFDEVEDGDGGTIVLAERELAFCGSDGQQTPPTEIPCSNDLPSLDVQQPRVIEVLTQWTPATQQGFLRLQLSDPAYAFLHSQYIKVLTRQSQAAAMVAAGGGVPKCLLGAKYRVYWANATYSTADTDNSATATGIDFENDPYCVATCSDPDSNQWDPSVAIAIIPNEPYTPTIKAFELGYESLREVSVDSNETSPALAFFHLEPFGYRSVPLSATWQDEEEGGTDGQKNPGPPPLLPQIDHEGSLFLGLEGLAPLQSLSILFQVAEATADTNVRKPTVQWSYLTDDKWKDFEEYEIINDTTADLTTSGIVTFSIPRGISEKNTRMPGKLHWLRAAVKEGAKGVSELIEAHTQAVRATFVDDGNDPRHLEAPLPAESVSGLVVDDAKVAGVEQPYNGFGGRPAEGSTTFYTRVSEHLRHKGRPITLFDYERLILERFPTLYKVKCINHTRIKYDDNSEDTGEVAFAPGQVLIAVIADFKPLKAVDRRKPKVTLDKLDEIAKYLQKINCPFVRNDRSDQRNRLHLSNPIYEEVQVAFKVRFAPDVSAIEFSRRKLNEEINQFLSPWAYEEGAEISFGGKMYKSSILNFVEQRSYVDFVTDFEMRRLDLPGTPQAATSDEDLDAVEASTPRSILVPALTHDIRPLAGPMCTMVRACSPEKVIGQMTIGTDFEVQSQPAGSS